MTGSKIIFRSLIQALKLGYNINCFGVDIIEIESFLAGNQLWYIWHWSRFFFFCIHNFDFMLSLIFVFRLLSYYYSIVSSPEVNRETPSLMSLDFVLKEVSSHCEKTSVCVILQYLWYMNRIKDYSPICVEFQLQFLPFHFNERMKNTIKFEHSSILLNGVHQKRHQEKTNSVIHEEGLRGIVCIVLKRSLPHGDKYRINEFHGQPQGLKPEPASYEEAEVQRRLNLVLTKIQIYIAIKFVWEKRSSMLIGWVIQEWTNECMLDRHFHFLTWFGKRGKQFSLKEKPRRNQVKDAVEVTWLGRLREHVSAVPT